MKLDRLEAYPTKDHNLGVTRRVVKCERATTSRAA
jgi:hypothetical protein